MSARTTLGPAVDSARRTAYDVLRAVDERDAYANLLLPSLLRERALSPRDAAFATELAYGTLRGLGTYDLVIDACSNRSHAQIDAPVRDLLRLGVHQLLGMRVPAHAAVSTTVDLTAATVSGRATGFVNALLRKVSARSMADWLSSVAPAYDSDPVGNLAVTHSHPRWIVEVFSDALGDDLAETARALAANNEPAGVTLVARPGGIDVAALVREAGPDARLGRWSPYAVHRPAGDPGALAAVREGRAAVQDEGSQLAALSLLQPAIESAPDHTTPRWLDLCAGPGGKAALLAARAHELGVHVLAADRALHRARLVRRTIGARSASLVIAADGTQPAWQPDTFDRVLVDAPCTGLGALRRRPEARWRKRADDADRLQRLQVDLLTTGVSAVRPGGVVAYVTCSPDRRETHAVFNELLARAPVRPIPVDIPGLTPETAPDARTGAVQLWPHRHETDAMYIGILRKSTES